MRSPLEGNPWLQQRPGDVPADSSDRLNPGSLAAGRNNHNFPNNGKGGKDQLNNPLPTLPSKRRGELFSYRIWKEKAATSSRQLSESDTPLALPPVEKMIQTVSAAFDDLLSEPALLAKNSTLNLLPFDASAEANLLNEA